MKKAGLLCLGGFWALSLAPAEGAGDPWIIQSRVQFPPVEGLARERLVARLYEAAIQLDFVRLDAQAFDWIVIDNGRDRAKPAYGSLEQGLRARDCLAGTNGGFFDQARFQPDGLQVADGVWTGIFDPKHGSRGVFVVRGGKPFLEQCDRCQADATVQQLLQTGPVLVWKKIPTDTLDNSSPNRRTFIGWDGGDRWILGQASRCGLRELSAFLASEAFAEHFPLQDALNMDGGPSSGFWAANAKGDPPFYIKEYSTVRNFIGVRPKS